MKTFLKITAGLLVAGWAHSLAAFTYSDTDLLLVFRKTGQNDVLCNLGNISNYLGQANGTTSPVTNWDFTQVQANFGGDLTGVKYVLMAVTASGDAPVRVWLSDSAPSGLPPNDESNSRWTQQRGKINAVGSRATSYPEVAAQTVILSPSDPNSYTFIASSGGALDVSTMSGSAPFPVEQDLGSSVRLYELKANSSNPKPFASQVGHLTLTSDGSLNFTAASEDIVIVVTNRIYSAFNTALTAGAYVYVDSDPAAGSPVRATQRSLGYREVDYKSQVPATLFFSQASPALNGDTISYDYSAQAAKTNTIGFWVDKDVPMLVGPDGLAYITDGHHTTAGYLTPLSPVRQLVLGKNRVILGHIVANFFDPMNPTAPDDAWWTARSAENNALLYGPDGDQLTLPGEPNYSNLQPILPSVLVMPTTPSTLTTNGAIAMSPSTYRGLTWGLADAMVFSATDASGKKIAGYKKSAPGSSVDINFVEFFWADYLRHRIVWDDTLTGSPFGSPNGDASVTAAPLSFFTAVANGIALARSEVYHDEYGRNLTDYTNSAVFGPNTLRWSTGSLSNGLAVATDTYNLYLRDDSTIAGDISPSAKSANILHVDTVAGLTVTQTLQNIKTIVVNAGGTLKTAWKDATVSNTTLRLPAGSGVVSVTGNNWVAANTILGGGTLDVEGTLAGNLQVTNGTLHGHGIVNGTVSVSASGTLAPGASIGTITINGPLTLAGSTVMEINKTGATLTSDLVNGITTLTYGGSLTLQASGDALVAGDSFKLFDAASYVAAFDSVTLPALDAGLAWDSSRLIVDGTITVGTSAATKPAIAAQPLTQTINVGANVTLIGGAVGTEPMSYQWRFNGGDLNGQTHSTLSLPNIQESSQGSYVFVATNSAGSITSAPAILTVNQAPVSQSQSLAMYWNNSLNIALAGSDADGDALTFTVVAQPAHGVLTGTAPNLTYTPASGFSGADNFTYKVNDGRLDSAVATISINVKLDFTYQDTDLLLVFRKSGFNDVLFDLGGVSNYLGRANGTIQGVTNYDFSRVLANFGGDLTGVKYVLMAVTTSTEPLLRAWLSDSSSAGVPSDETQSRWTQQRAKINAVGSRAATYDESSGASNQSLSIPSSDPNSYTSIASAGGALDVSTMGGAAPFPVEQDLGTDIRLFELRVSTANPKPFSAQIGRFSLEVDGSLNFTAGSIPPAITTEPSSQSVECGSAAIFSVAVTGDPPLSYQWRFEGSDISGATSSTLTITPASFANAGHYTVVVSNAGGSVMNNNPALLTVVDTTPPLLSMPANVTVAATSSAGASVGFSATANDLCAGSVVPICVPASGSTFALGVTTVNCTANDGNGNTGSGSFTITVIPGFTYSDTDLLLVLRKTGFNDVLFDLGGISNYLGLANGTALNPSNFDFTRAQASFGGDLTGVKYILMSVTTSTDPLLRTWLSDSSSSGVPNDESQSRWTQQRGKINAIGSRAAAYFYPDATNQSLSITPSDPNSYTFIASSGGALDVSTMGGAAPFPVEQDLGTGIRLFELRVSTANPKPFSTQVGRFTLGVDGSLAFTAGSIPPAITTEPSGQSVECGGLAAFSVTASGDSPLSYQWRLEGSEISGATSSTLTIAPAAFANAGHYTVVVSNAGGSATNDHPALLTVVDTTPPVLSVPANLTVTATSSAGASVAYSATANDICAGNLAPVCVPAPGSTFVLGATMVNCTTDDGNGNSSSSSFTVTVKAGFTYSDTDLLLVLRKTGFNDVLFDLGGISNYLGLANGTTLNPSNFDFTRAQASFGGDLTGVKYILMSVTTSTDPLLRTWLSDSSSSGVPADESQSRWTQQRGKINAIGSRAAAYFYPDATNQSLSISPSDPNSYTFIASSGGALDVSTMGGAAPFPVEQDLGTDVRLFELKVSTASPKPFSAQVGRFTLGSDGSLSFVAEANVAPVAQDNGVATEQNHALVISSAQLLANDSDPDHDPLLILSVSATSTNGGTVTLNSGSITYTPVSGFTGLDRFSYTISDGRGGTATAQVDIFVSDGPLPGPNAVAIAPVVNGFRIRFGGVPGQTYQLQRAPAITGPWSSFGAPMVAPSYGIIESVDANPPPGMAFYQALAQ